MFESEDFDLDEDFLKDIGAKEEEFYSQKVETDNRQTKRRKTEDLSEDIFADITFDDEPDFVKTKTIPSSIELTNSSSALKSQNEIVLERLDLQSEISQSKEEKTILDSQRTKKSPPRQKTDENIEISRRKMALEILRKASSSVDKNPNVERESKSEPLRQISSDGERNVLTENDEKRRRMILEKFKKPISPVSTPKVAKNSPKFQFRDKRSTGSSRMTLIRKFPGPAGLLPENPDPSFDNTNFLKRLDDANKDENDDDSEISEYCSQNTERMFSAGAWRLMLDDLPRDYLKGHEIATIKRREGSDWSSGGNSRIPILAGVIQKIDHGIENPRLILKDLSDSIQGTMHSDIILAHPNIFEPGVVVLLRNVGLLEIRGSQTFVGPQFHVIIAPKNVVAVYSEKSRLVTSSFMESWTRDQKQELNNVPSTSKTNRRLSSSKSSEKSPEKSPPKENNFDIDDEDFQFDIGEIEDSQIAPCFSKGNIVNEVKIQEEKRMISRNEKFVDKRNFERMEESVEESRNEAVIEMKPKKIVSVRSRLLQFQSKDALTPPINSEVNDIEISSKNQNLDIPMEISEEKKSSHQGAFEDLLDSDNDTEDEILSQLDVDSIVTNYNKGT